MPPLHDRTVRHMPEGIPVSQCDVGMQCKYSYAWQGIWTSRRVATVTGRGTLPPPAELRKRFGISQGDKVEMRATRKGIVLERIPTLMEGFGEDPGIGRGMAGG